MLPIKKGNLVTCITSTSCVTKIQHTGDHLTYQCGQILSPILKQNPKSEHILFTNIFFFFQMCLVHTVEFWGGNRKINR